MRKKIDLKVVLTTATKPEADENLTFAELFRAWNAVTKNADDAYRIRKWLDAFDGRVAWSLTTHEIAAAAKGMLEHGYAAGSVNRDVGCIGSAFKWIIQDGKAPAGFVSPTILVERYKEDRKAVEITPAQIAGLKAVSLTYINKLFPVFVHLLIDTGARKGELYPRKWADCDLDRRRIVLEAKDTKTNKARVLFFSPETAALIRRFVPERHRQPDMLMFPGRDRSEQINFRSSWISLTAKVGVDIGMHACRHNKARELILAGLPLSQIAQLLGHGVQVLEDRYGTLAVSDKQAIADTAWTRKAAA